MRHPAKMRRVVYGMFILSSTFIWAAPVGAEPQSHPKESKHRAVKETVLITYHVAPGKEKTLEGLLAEVWVEYAKEHLVFSQPHVVVREKTVTGKYRVVEIFTWVNPDAPDHAPDSVKKLWGQMRACCEKRDGRPGLDVGEVDLLVPESR